MARQNSKPTPLELQSTTNTIAIKCHEEQLPKGLDHTLTAVRELDSDKYDVYAIWHDKTAKPHLHVGLRVKNGKTSKVNPLLTKLGIQFRSGLDDNLKQNHGLETLGSFTGYFVYLSHKDKKSQKLKKATYDVSDYVTNMNRDEFESLMVSRIPIKKKSALERHMENCKAAFEAGYSLRDFDSFFEEKEYIGIPQTKVSEMRTFHNRGLRKIINETGSIPRLCVYIDGNGVPDLSNESLIKATKSALSGMNVLTVQRSMHDLEALRLDTDGIICFDGLIDPVKFDLTEFFSDAIKEIKVNKSRLFWTGKYFIIVSTSIASSRNKLRQYSKWFYLCHIDSKEIKLICDQVSALGTVEEQTARKSLYMDFRNSFNNELANMSTLTNVSIDYSDINQ